MKTQLLYIFVLFSCIRSVQAEGAITLSGENRTGGTYIACSSISLTNTFSFSATATGKSLLLKVSPSTCDPFGGTDIDPTKMKDQNYIRTKIYLDNNASRYLDQIQYFDGLGRPVQIVQRAVTPNAKDLVTLQEYDAFGRASNIWLPAIVADNNGGYVAPATVRTGSIASNGNDQSPYNQPVYEASPLNRILEQYSPGQDWKINTKAIRTGYLTNKDKTGTILLADSLVCGFYVSSDDRKVISISKSKNYAATELYITRIKDEDNNVSYEYKDKLGQVILIRQINDSQMHDTYYIYESFGNLRVVLPPLASDKLAASGTWTDTNADLQQLAYLYKYDARNRCIAKKQPGCEWIYYIYDKADRIIFTQDGEQRKKTPAEWLFSIPDAFGRVVLSGVCENVLDYTANPLGSVVVKAEWPLAGNGLYKGYNISGVTPLTYTILSVNYFDQYNFIGKNSVPTDIVYAALSGYGAQYTGGYKGLLTGTTTALLDGSATPAYIYTALYYDYRGRIIQTKSTNHLSGGIEKEYIAYNFTGQPIQKQHIHSATGKTTQTEVYKYTYDHAGRLLTTTHQLNNGTVVTLAENTYDELGRLKTNVKNNQTNLKTDYTYNIRSWIKSMKSPLYHHILYYNDSYNGKAVCYNGNISAINWNVWNQATNNWEKDRAYAFSYDQLSRLTAAAYMENGGVLSDNYKTAYTYDKHGNMKTLQRYGKTSSGSTFGLIDNLTITHTGNQLLSVSDAGVIVSIAESADFKNHSNAATEYLYNTNGAMYKDLNKGISNIQYNTLNLPRIMDIKSPVAEARNEYTYSASGTKLKVVQKWNPNYSTAPVIGSDITPTLLTKTETTDYVGNIIYESHSDGTSKTRILIDGGYIEGDIYYFYLTDHLGNNRVVANASGTIIQKNHYYPFGMTFAETPLAEQKLQPYKYNGKELDPMHGLNLYDYSARYLDATIPSFTTMDPLAEKYYQISPYAYVANNPIKFIDPDGKEKLPYYFTPSIDSYNASLYPDDKAIHIFTHSTNTKLYLQGFRGYNTARVSSASELNYVLSEDSETWKNRGADEELTIVIHGCDVADVGADGMSLAEKLSASPEFKNHIIIAPDKKFILGNQNGVFKYIGVYGMKYSNGERVVNKKDKGRWIVYKNGEIKNVIPGDQMPTSQNIKQDEEKKDNQDNKNNTKPENFWGPIRREFYNLYGY